MIMNRIKYLLTAAATVALIGACTEDIGNEGPQLEDLYGDFRLVTGLETSADDVNFSAGEKMYFTAAFNKSTDWEIHLKGQTSGAEKVITGKSRMLDQSNATWDGSTTIFPMFREEQVAVSLVVPEGSLEMMDTVNVLGTKINDGLIVADFESGLNPGWEVFKQSGARMKFEIKNDSAAQGQACYDLAGEVNWDWLIGYLYLPASALPDTVLNGGTTYPLSSNPNQVYLNLLVYSPAEYNNELLLIRINEDDNLNGSHNGSNEDQWSAEIREVAAGWNQISLRYADLVTLVNGAPGNPAGNGVHEPEKINKIELLMLANPNSGYSRLLIDYIIFTEGGPLEP
jgi:hypothetical protein